MGASVFAAFVAALFVGILLWPLRAHAHCDTLDGPAVKDGRRALEAGNLNLALKWIGEQDEAELAAVFDQCLAVRRLDDTAKAVADRLFLETLVRLHRLGEGAGFDGLKPSGTALDPAVLAADEAIEHGTIEPLRDKVPGDRLPELERRLRVALGLKDFDDDDVAAGRSYVAAYVSFFKYAEGEEHAHEHHAHDHHSGHSDPHEHSSHEGHDSQLLRHEHH